MPTALATRWVLERAALLTLVSMLMQGGSASMDPTSRGASGAGQTAQGGQRQQAGQQGNNQQTAVQHTGRPRAYVARRPRGGRAGDSLLTPFFANDVPGYVV